MFRITVAEHGRVNLKRVDAATGKVEAVTTGDHEVQSYTATPDVSKMVLLISSPVNIGDLFLLDMASGKLAQLTNWTVGHTNRFKAAVSQRSIADWAGFWYTADFTLFQPTWFRGAPWEDPEDFTKRSPITYIKNVTTPMMFIEGEADYRTPPADGGEIMFRALKYRKIPTVMVRFPNESHELSRSGAPWHRVERLQHILNWFDKYLQDKPIKLYDVE